VLGVKRGLGKKLTLGVLLREWPSYEDTLATNIKDFRGEQLEDSEVKYTYPVLMKYFEHIWQDEFWDSYVRQFGANLLPQVAFGRARGDKKNIILNLGNYPRNPTPANAFVLMIEQERELSQNTARDALASAMLDYNSLKNLCRNVKMPDMMVLGVPEEEGEYFDEQDWDVGNDSDFEWDIPNPLEPQGYRNIFTIVHKYRLILAFESMKKRIPVHLVLVYINRQRDLDGQGHVGHDDWHAFLKYTSSRSELFL
jgi:hypothetical protein